MRMYALALTGGLYACAASAQVAPVNSAPAQQIFVGQAQSQYAMLRTGTKVALKTSESLTTKGKKLRVGHRFQMEVAEPVTVDGQVVIPAGSPAVGEITDVRNKGMWGKSGRINARVLHVSANGRQIRMSGMLDDKGVTGTAGVVAAVAFVPIAGFFTTGTSAKIDMGAPVVGFIDEDVPLNFAAAAPAPMVVGAPVTAATAPAPMAAPAMIPAVATAKAK